MPPFEEEFYVSWIDSYTLYVRGAAHMELNTKQQTILLPPDVASGLV